MYCMFPYVLDQGLFNAFLTSLNSPFNVFYYEISILYLKGSIEEYVFCPE